MSEQTTHSKAPQPDPAEKDAFFPSSYSLSQFTAPKSDLSGADYPNPYKGRQKILMIGADERYLLTDNGSFFSTGNHPVETLLPMYHLDKAGFAFDVATVSGNPVKFEFWAMPSEDEAVKGFFDKYHPQFKRPLALADVVAKGLDEYAAVFIPGGHGALIGLPESDDVGAAPLPQLLTPREAAEIQDMYDDVDRFRSTIDMARYRGRTDDPAVLRRARERVAGAVTRLIAELREHRAQDTGPGTLRRLVNRL